MQANIRRILRDILRNTYVECEDYSNAVTDAGIIQGIGSRVGNINEAKNLVMILILMMNTVNPGRGVTDYTPT